MNDLATRGAARLPKVKYRQFQVTRSTDVLQISPGGNEIVGSFGKNGRGLRIRSVGLRIHTHRSHFRRTTLRTVMPVCCLP